MVESGRTDLLHKKKSFVHISRGNFRKRQIGWNSTAKTPCHDGDQQLQCGVLCPSELATSRTAMVDSDRVEAKKMKSIQKLKLYI